MQENESPLFLSYFKSKAGGSGSIEYLPGGVASGFHHVVRGEHRTRLLQVKGKRVARVTEVPLHSSSLSTSDVFVLDDGQTLYLYVGATANTYEKVRLI